MNHFIADFSPVALSFGFIEIRWYALAYIGAFLLGVAWMKRMARRSPDNISAEQVSNFMSWAILGVLIGGRLGYVFFYQPSYYLANPMEIPAIWQGGMAFHGGMLGMFIATLLYCKRQSIPTLAMGDLLACAAPIGLFLGRIANFINGELWGHPTDVPWAVVFPVIDNLPRHPSQIYEALLEGLMIFIIINILAFRGTLKRRGMLSGLFLALYGISRIIVEEFRVSDPVPVALENILIVGAWGQWLSVPMVLIGMAVMIRSGRQ